MRVLLCILAVLAVAAPAAGQTYVTQDITVSETWTPAGSPYIIQANIVVGLNAVLTIQASPSAGVTVAFDGDYELDTQLNGQIIAEGNADHHVLFTSNAGSPSMSDWQWVELTGSGLSTFTYCTIEYARTGIRPNNRDVAVSHCVVRHCLEGFYCLSTGSTIDHCDIYDNNYGIYTVNSLDRDLPAIHNCNLYDNSNANLRVGLFPEPAATIDAENNWWGTDVEAEIQAGIHDSTDDPAIYSTVDYDPWLHEVPVEATSWGRVKALFLE